MGEKTEDGNRRLIADAGKNVYSYYGGVVPVKVDMTSFSGRGEETERTCNIKIFPPIGVCNKKKPITGILILSGMAISENCLYIMS